ncbi:MAG: HNH endonuclease [Rhodomicrobium sp.]
MPYSIFSRERKLQAAKRRRNKLTSKLKNIQERRLSIECKLREWKSRDWNSNVNREMLLRQRLKAARSEEESIRNDIQENLETARAIEKELTQLHTDKSKPEIVARTISQKRQKYLLTITQKEMHDIQEKITSGHFVGKDLEFLREKLKTMQLSEESLRKYIEPHDRRPLRTKKGKLIKSGGASVNANPVRIKDTEPVEQTFLFDKVIEHIISPHDEDAQTDSNSTIQTTGIPSEYLVPTPSEKDKLDREGFLYPSRDGQLKFRDLILETYGRCAISGCTDKAALEAAHIIPYVNSNSNIVQNGLCLRADLHRLYDRNLMRVGGNYEVTVDFSIKAPEYISLHGSKIALPENEDNWPDPELLAIRHRYI